MGKLLINSEFKAKKAATIPVVAVPKNVKQSLCIDEANANGIFKIEPVKGMAMYDRCYVFEDINYVNQDDDKRTETLLEFLKLLKSMDCSYKISVASEQRDMDAFFEEIFTPIHGEEYPLLEEGIGAFINQKIEEGVRDIERLLLLTITCRANSFDEAECYFGSMDTMLQNIFSAMGSRLYRMSGVERLALLQRMLRAGGQGIPPKNVAKERGEWKNQILPSCIEQHGDYLKLGERYACVMFGQDYAQSLQEDKVIHSLANNLFPVYITLDMEPVPQQMVIDKLLNANANNDRSIELERDKNNRQKQFGKGVSYFKNKRSLDIKDEIEMVEKNDEEGVFIGFLVMVTGGTLEELTERVDTLQRVAVSNGFTLEIYYHRQLKALNTVLPVGGRQVDHMRFFYISSAAALQPFYATDLQQPGGFVFGLNRTTKRLLYGNRKKLAAPHGVIIGPTGRGKSFFIKITEIIQTLLFTGDDVIILDPNNEQMEFIRALKGGQYFDFTPRCQIYMNPFEVPEYVRNGDAVIRDKFLADMKDYAGTFCTAVMKNITVTQVHLTYIGRAVQQMYEEYFSRRLPDKKQLPTWIRLRELLMKQAESSPYPDERRMILDIVDSLEEYTIGAYDMFAHPSNQDIHGRLVGFGLKNIPETAWEPAMMTIMHFLAMRIRYDHEHQIALSLVIDEAQEMSKREASAHYFLYAVTTYRKYGATVTLAFQNLTHVLRHPELCDMLSNCYYKCFFSNGGVDAAAFSEIQELSEIEYRKLSGQGQEKGHCVIVWDGQVYIADSFMSHDNVLYPLLNTDPHEKAEEKRKQDEEQGKEAPPGR